MKNVDIWSLARALDKDEEYALHVNNKLWTVIKNIGEREGGVVSVSATTAFNEPR